MPGSDNRDSNHWATPLLTILFVLLLLTPALMLVNADTDSFSASVTVNNLPPSVTVNAGQAITGQISGSTIVHIVFNASDPNGAGDLNTSSASITLNKTGNSPRTSSACVLESEIDANTRQYNCSITLWYFDEAGPWTINASIEDNTSNPAYDDSETVQVQVLDSVSMVAPSISFSGTPGTDDIASSPEPQQLNNTGNQDYNQINITGFDFASGANRISVGNVTMNTTDSNGPGIVLQNGTTILLSGASLARGNNSLEDVYFWLDIPSATPTGTYNAQSNWIVETTPS